MVYNCNPPLKLTPLKVEAPLRFLYPRSLLMRTSKFSETQIVSILKQQDAGVKTADICRE